MLIIMNIIMIQSLQANPPAPMPVYGARRRSESRPAVFPISVHIAMVLVKLDVCHMDAPNV
jgi:hypothetical protein